METVVIRPLKPEDEPELERFLEHLSLRSLAMRFFSAGISPHRAAHEVVDVDGRERFGLVAERDGHIVGHAMYVRSKPDTVDTAFAVADDLQHHGIGSTLVADIAEAAKANGFRTLEADVLPENRRMLEVFSHSGLPLHLRAAPGSIHVTADLTGEDRWNEHSSLDTTVQRPQEKLSLSRLPG